jgi:drug/metabolite transporter (DMT)-like permease
MNMVMNLTPFFTAALGWILLGESLSGVQFMGMIVIVAGVALVQLSGSKKSRAPEGSQ